MQCFILFSILKICNINGWYEIILNSPPCSVYCQQKCDFTILYSILKTNSCQMPLSQMAFKRTFVSPEILTHDLDLAMLTS